MIENGLDRLLEHADALRSRQFGLLSHNAARTSSAEPILLALDRLRVRPEVLFAPEHGFHSVEQDMVPSDDEIDSFSGIATRSLYGDRVQSLQPTPEAFRDLDLLVVDLVDIGTRYYTYAATAVWAIEVALAAGVEVWLADRPNPLGGWLVEGPGIDPDLHSFVGAFDLPVRHGLTLGEIVTLVRHRAGLDSAGLKIWQVQGWQGSAMAAGGSWRWHAPSPNMPTRETATVYPGGCLIEATSVSEGRGTTRPFELIGAPWVDGPGLARSLTALSLSGVKWLPTRFRPQFQKHAGEVCEGVEVLVSDESVFNSFRSGVELIAALSLQGGTDFGWRPDAYEFVEDRHAIDLLTGSCRLRELLAAGEPLTDWLATWPNCERAFIEESETALLYSRSRAGASRADGRAGR